MLISITVKCKKHNHYVILVTDSYDDVFAVTMTRLAGSGAVPPLRYTNRRVSKAHRDELVAIMRDHLEPGIAQPRFYLEDYPEVGIFLDRLADLGYISWEDRGLFV